MGAGGRGGEGVVVVVLLLFAVGDVHAACCGVRGGATARTPRLDRTGSTSAAVVFGGLAAPARVPAAPAHFLELYVAVWTTGFAAAANTTTTAFESADDETPGFGGWDAGEAGDGGGEVAHDVADGEGTMVEEDFGEVVFGE